MNPLLDFSGLPRFAELKPQHVAPAVDQFALQALFKRLTDVSFMTQLSSEMIVRKITYSGADKFPIPAYFFSAGASFARTARLRGVSGKVAMKAVSM